MPYEQLIREAHENVSKLQNKLQSLDNVYNEIKLMKDNAGAIPGVFESKYNEVVKLSKAYLDNVKELETEYLTHLKGLSADYLKSYDTQLKKYDKDFAEKVKLLQGKSDGFETKLNTFKTHNDGFYSLIKRLENVEIEQKLQNLQTAINDVKGQVIKSTDEVKSSLNAQVNTLKSEINHNKDEIITLRNEMNKSTKMTWLINGVGFVIIIILVVMLLLK